MRPLEREVLPLWSRPLLRVLVVVLLVVNAEICSTLASTGAPRDLMETMDSGCLSKSPSFCLIYDFDTDLNLGLPS